MLNYLDENGLTENTIVIYTSDQGFYLGEHGWYDKSFMYEQSMLTPLMIRYPALVKPGQEKSELVQNLDFAPTLLEFGGVPIPDDMQGLSLVPLSIDAKSAS
jgi:arylsulfatase A-like enzyme